MKFIYLDESGTGSEPFAVMVGIIVDSQRMHRTKSDWQELLSELTTLTGKEIKEFHTRDFYRGNGPWRGIDGATRGLIIETILDWLENRKHKISFSGIDKELYFKELVFTPKLKEINSYWCLLAFHQILIVQKVFQKEEKTKGNTVIIFDNEVTEEKALCQLIINPPVWSDYYYNKSKKKERLDQIVDVPYFGDSEQVHLLQVSDLIAYILRLFLELKNNKTIEKYPGELNNLNNWVSKIQRMSLSTSTRYPSRGRDECSELFYKYAPKELRLL